MKNPRALGVFSLWKGAWPNVQRAMIVTTSQLVTDKTCKEFLKTNSKFLFSSSHDWAQVP